MRVTVNWFGEEELSEKCQKGNSLCLSLSVLSKGQSCPLTRKTIMKILWHGGNWRQNKRFFERNRLKGSTLELWRELWVTGGRSELCSRMHNPQFWICALLSNASEKNKGPRAKEDAKSWGWSEWRYGLLSLCPVSTCIPDPCMAEKQLGLGLCLWPEMGQLHRAGGIASVSSVPCASGATIAI